MTRFAPERIVAALNDAGIAYVIVGGIAAPRMASSERPEISISSPNPT